MFTLTHDTPIDEDFAETMALATDLVFDDSMEVDAGKVMVGLLAEQDSDLVVTSVVAMCARLLAAVAPDDPDMTLGQLADDLVAMVMGRVWEQDDAGAVARTGLLVRVIFNDGELETEEGMNTDESSAVADLVLLVQFTMGLSAAMSMTSGADAGDPLRGTLHI